MQPIPLSGFANSNKYGRITLLALEEVMGKHGVNAILNLARLSHFVDNYPPANLERQFDFAYTSSLMGALEEMYGVRGGRVFALRAGKATFEDLLSNYGAMAGVGDIAFRMLPLHLKMRIGLGGMARVFSSISDQLTKFEDKGDHFVYSIQRCPACWARHTEKPGCFIMAGIIMAGLKWVSNGHDFRVSEATCIGMGDPSCDFIISKEPIQ